MSSFRVGQKVVLVNDASINGGSARFYWEAHGAIYPVLNTVYTVRKVANHSISGIELLLLAGIDNEAVSNALGYVLEQGFEAYRFRPVVTRKTDISIFKSMLKPSRQTVEA